MNKRTARRSRRPKHRWDYAPEDADYQVARDKHEYDKERKKEAKAWLQYAYNQLCRDGKLSEGQKKALQSKHKFLKYNEKIY